MEARIAEVRRNTKETRIRVRVNLDGVFLGAKHAIRVMTTGGAVVIVSSATGAMPAAGASAAIHAARAGLRVTVVDRARFPREDRVLVEDVEEIGAQLEHPHVRDARCALHRDVV